MNPYTLLNFNIRWYELQNCNKINDFCQEILK